MESTCSSKKFLTRSSTNVWLIGQQLQCLDLQSCSNRLPTSEQALRRLFYDLKTCKLSLSQSCSNVIDEVFGIYFLSHIPTTQKPNAVAKLKGLYDRHVKLAKNKGRRTDRQKELEDEFGVTMNKLFDVAHADCNKIPSLIKIPEDIMLLEDQRRERKMEIGQEDTEFKEREGKRQQRQQEEMNRIEKAKKDAAVVCNSSYVASTDESDQEINTNRHECDPEIPISKYHLNKIPQSQSSPTLSFTSENPLKKRRLVDDPLFLASLDRTKTTSREAMHIVAPALKAVGVDIDSISLSTSTIHRARKVARKTLVETQKSEFAPNTPLVAHFDGKLLPNSNGRMEELVDRMPIVVSGVNMEKLLEIPKLPTSTGEMMGNAVVQALREWTGVTEWLAGLCFDTTSSNTGIHTGAITVIQRMLDRHLLFLACRHHILEILSSAVFDNFFKSSGPQISLFSRFKEQWKFIDTTKYSAIDVPITKTGLTDNEEEWFRSRKDEVISFLQNFLHHDTQPRQDYLEFVKLSLIMMNCPTESPVHFSPPGAYHRARWMAKGIYCLKIYLFREQFKLTAHETQALRRICR